MCAYNFLVNKASSVQCSSTIEIPVTDDICKIDWLDDYSLRHIFSKLSLEDRITASKVDRRWQAIISSMCYKITDMAIKFCSIHETLLWDKLNTTLELVAPFIKEVEFLGIYRVDEVFSSVARNCVNLNVVHLNSMDFTSCGPLPLLKECPQLKKLSFFNCKGLTDNLLCYFFKEAVTGVEVISFSFLDEIKGKFLAVINLPIKSLYFYRCHNLTPIYVYLGVKRLKHTLTSLNVSDCDKITKHDCELISRFVPKLKYLSLTEVKLSFGVWSTLKGIENFTQLEVLDLSNNDCVSDSVINSVVNCCRELKVLRLSSFTKNGISQFTETSISQLGRLTNLEELEITALDVVNDESLKAFSKMSSTSKIRKLICSYCRNLGDVGAISVFSCCPELELFDLAYSAVTIPTVEEAVNFVRRRKNNLPLTLILTGTLCERFRLENYEHPLLYILKFDNHHCPLFNETPDDCIVLCCNCPQYSRN